jgi:protein O-GlcNAc transferase
MQRWSDSLAWLEHALKQAPQSALAWYNLGVSLEKLGRDADSQQAYERCLQLQADYFDAIRNLGTLALKQGDPKRAVGFLKQALGLEPKHANALVDLGNALSQIRDKPAAQEAYRLALSIDPDLQPALYNYAVLLLSDHRMEEAIELLERADKQQPGYSQLELIRLEQRSCRWGNTSRRVQAIRDGLACRDTTVLESLEPFSFLTIPYAFSAAEQWENAKEWAKRFSTAPGTRYPLSSRPEKSQRLRIGYLSADLQDHATSWLIVELFEEHDRKHFEVFAYSLMPDDGLTMRPRIVKAVDCFRDVADWNARTIADQIASDKIDILVDLKGYTENARTQILAFRPAPIQVSYLGYPGTMGANFIDYIFVDEYVVPPSQQVWYTEKLHYLPGCYQANDSRMQRIGDCRRMRS